MDRTTFALSMAAGSAKDAIGQIEYLVAGTYSLVVPDYVTSLSAALLQGGSGGHATDGGDGGDLRWTTNILVSPGETLTVAVGDGGAGTQLTGALSPGFHSTISRGATLLFSSSTPLSATVGGGIGGIGGNGFGHSGNAANGGGGGGAAGYAGNGGKGASTNADATAGSGGGGGGGGLTKSTTTVYTGRDGGGVGILGQGTSGAAAAGYSVGGYGSSATNVTNGAGGGGGSGVNSTYSGARDGKPGAARIIWGQGRAYPSTRTANE